MSNATARDRSGTIIGQLGYGAHLDRDPILGAGDATSVWSLLRSRSISVVTPVVDGGTKVGELQLVSDTDDIVDGLLATLGANMAGAGVALLAGLLVAAIAARASSSAARAARPSPCGLDGLAQRASPSAAAARAAAVTGVVAAWSR